MLDLVTLTSNQLTKQSLNEWAAAMVSLIEDGELNPLEAHAKAKAIVAALTDVIKSTEDLAQDEAAKYGSKTFEAFGAQVTLKEGAVTPDYAQDPVWVQMKEALKSREDLLKTAMKTKDAAIIDTYTGEVIPVVQPKYAKSSISIQFK
jgi:hypothetical protein